MAMVVVANATGAGPKTGASSKIQLSFTGLDRETAAAIASGGVVAPTPTPVGDDAAPPQPTPTGTPSTSPTPTPTPELAPEPSPSPPPPHPSPPPPPDPSLPSSPETPLAPSPSLPPPLPPAPPVRRKLAAEAADWSGISARRVLTAQWQDGRGLSECVDFSLTIDMSGYDSSGLDAAYSEAMAAIASASSLASNASAASSGCVLRQEFHMELLLDKSYQLTEEDAASLASNRIKLEIFPDPPQPPAAPRPSPPPPLQPPPSPPPGFPLPAALAAALADLEGLFASDDSSNSTGAGGDDEFAAASAAAAALVCSQGSNPGLADSIQV